MISKITATKNTAKAYEKIVRAFKARKKGATNADISAATGLPLNTVRELVPAAADEYNGRLEVTESGEILYSFPHGFSSRYRGFGPSARKAATAAHRAIIAAGTSVFKIWIMVMLVGYFIVFMLIALASLFLSLAASSSNNRSRRGSTGNMYFSMSIFNLILRLWFYSELTKPRTQGGFEKSRTPSKPLHRAIFSFIFGDKDPNAAFEDEIKKTFIAYLKENRGVISLPEFMVISGLEPDEAGQAISAICVEFNGSPEATEDGTVVYRFDEILLASEKSEKKNGLPLHFKALESFSSNPEKMNWWFNVINGVNLVFGTYFLYNAFSIGHFLAEQSSRIYMIVYLFLLQYTDPLPVITIALGIVPLVFSFLFWLIPILRRVSLNKKNTKLRFENFRKFSFLKIWNSPLAVKKTDLSSPYKDANPDNLTSAQDIIIREMGAYSIPEVSLDDSKNELYSFAELQRERKALEKYRLTINPEDSSIGKTVFDSSI